MNRQSMADRSPRKADKRSEMQQEEEKEKNAEEAAEAAPRSRRRGRPASLHTKEMVLHIRCTTEQRDTFARMGGSVWFRSFLDTLQAGFDRAVNSSSGEED